MTSDADFERLLAGIRPKLQRYCARMIGSAVDGEDLVQDVLIRAISARTGGVRIHHFEGWVFRVAHNACLDFLRAKARSNVIQLADEMQRFEEQPKPDLAVISFRAFLNLPILQRCAVILKDVLGHTIEEIAEIVDWSAPAAKSALQRGRGGLRELAARGAGELGLPVLPEDERQRLLAYVSFFRAGDFNSIRRMLRTKFAWTW